MHGEVNRTPHNAILSCTDYELVLLALVFKTSVAMSNTSIQY
jgi:hypothetical protein